MSFVPTQIVFPCRNNQKWNNGLALVSALAALQLAACDAANSGMLAAGGKGGNASSLGGSAAIGGSPSVGGAAAIGGTSNRGGSQSAGGASSSGGTMNLGGDASNGGQLSVGGTPAAGGTSTSDGTGGNQPSTGGALAMTGGNGSTATGGNSPAGGAIGTGGARATGGLAATGGNRATGGNLTTGGAVSATTGGNPSTGGAGGAPSTLPNLAVNVIDLGIRGGSDLQFYLEIANLGTASVDASTITLRYWYHDDGWGSAPLTMLSYYVSIGGSSGATVNLNKVATVPAGATNTDRYAELSFTGIIPTGGAGTINGRLTLNVGIHTASFSGNEDVTNDYSYNAGALGRDDKITLYVGDALVWGVEP